MADSANRVVVELIGDINNLRNNTTAGANDFERNMGRIESSAAGAERGLQHLSAQGGAAVRNLSFQIGDVGSQLASGSSPFIIIAQQGPQVTQALQDISASGATLGQVLKGTAFPGFLAVLSVLPSLISMLPNGADAADDHAKAEKALADALRDQEAASRQAIATGQRQIFIDRARADASLKVAVAKREETKALLATAIARLRSEEQQAVGGRAANYGALGVAQQSEGDIARLQALAAQQDAAIAQAQATVTRTQAKITQTLVQESLDPIAKATGQYERSVDLLNSRLEQGQVTAAQYRDEYRRLTQQHDAAVDAAQKAEKSTSRKSAADREAAKAARAHAKELDTLRSDLDAVTRSLDPSAAAAEDFAKTLDTIRDARLSGIISDSRALELGLRASAAEAKRLQERDAAQARDILGNPSNAIDEITRDREQQEHAETEVAIRADNEAQRVREDNVRSLAGLYEDLFTGGVHSVWDSFKRQALSTLAEIAAQETFKLILGGGSTIFGGTGLLSSIFGGGRASGGPVSAGTLYRVNEAGGPEGFVPNTGGKIIPLGQMNAATRAPITQVHQYFTLDARYGITTPELLQHVNSVAQQQAARAGAVAYGKAVSDTPGRIQQQQTLGN